jgi:hypothetical protein
MGLCSLGDSLSPAARVFTCLHRTLGRPKLSLEAEGKRRDLVGRGCLVEVRGQLEGISSLHSPFTMWIPETELRLSDLAADAVTHEPSPGQC